MIVFTQREDGAYEARVGKIAVVMGEGAYDMTVYEECMAYPCEWSACPSGRSEQDCPGEECPYAALEEQLGQSLFHGGFSSLSEVEEDIRSRLARGWHGDGEDDPGRNFYPQPEAERFAREEWTYERAGVAA